MIEANGHIGGKIRIHGMHLRLHHGTETMCVSLSGVPPYAAQYFFLLNNCSKYKKYQKHGTIMISNVERMGETRNEYKIFARKLNRQLERPGRRWENSITMDLKNKDVEVWIGLIWLR
jgi:hypothetical protein